MRRWQYNIKMDFKKLNMGMDSIDLAQKRDRWWGLVKAATDIWVP